MIGKDELAEACRNADAIAEEHQDIPAYWRERGVDPDALTYVAMQRGLRMLMLKEGLDPNDGGTMRLTRAEQEHQASYAVIFMDGFAAAWSVAAPRT